VPEGRFEQELKTRRQARGAAPLQPRAASAVAKAFPSPSNAACCLPESLRVARMAVLFHERQATPNVSARLAVPGAVVPSALSCPSAVAAEEAEGMPVGMERAGRW